MADTASSRADAPSPVHPGAGRSRALPPDPGRATELLYQRHGVTVLRYAWHLLGRREDAEDASQATFLAVHRALAAGTAVLEPGAWVLGIARNECLGRLRQRVPMPEPDPLEHLAAPAAGAPERLAEVRDQVRVARHTLRALPVHEREAFVMREWLGLGTAEVALAMSLTPVEVESLAGRARRSLVLAVGGLEPAVGCAGTRTALEAGTLGRAGTVHLLRCPVCRGVRRALRPPAVEGAARGPIAVVGQRLAGALPGFASGGGGIVAVLTTKAAAAPLLAKTAAVVIAALATAGVAQHEILSAVHGQHVAVSVPARGGEARTLAIAPAARPKVIVRAPVTPTTPAAPLSSRTPERPKVRLVALSVPAVSHVRGGVASAAGDSKKAPVSSTGDPASTDGRKNGAAGGSDGNDHSSPSSKSDSNASSGGAGERPKDSASEKPAAKTDTGGNQDAPSSSQPSSGRHTPKDGSGNDGGSSTSDGSGHDAPPAVTVPPATTPVVGSHGGGDGGSGKGDGSGGSGSPSTGAGGGDSATLATGPPPAAPQSPTGDSGTPPTGTTPVAPTVAQPPTGD